MPTLFKRSNGIYYALLPGPNGNRKWVSTHRRNKPEALSCLNEITDRGRKSSVEIHLGQFRAEVLSFVGSTFAPETVSVYTRGLDQLLTIVGDCPLTSVSGRSVDLYKRVRSTRVTGVTLNIELRTLKAAFNIAHRWGYIQTNPFAHVKLMRIDDTPPAFLSVDEFKRIISGIPDDWFRRAIIIAGLSGLRRGELINLRWSDVDLAAKMFKIQSHDGFRTKFGKRRLVPIHPEVYSILKILELEKNGMYVLQEGGNKILDRRLTKRFKERLRRLTMDERLHFHSLRHSYASWLIQTRAASIYEVQQILGHSSIKITESYSHLLPENLGRTVEALRVELD